MIAVDTSAMIAYLKGEQHVARLTGLIETRELILPPVVLAEILSSPDLEARDAAFIAAIPLLEVHMGFWARAGELRKSLLTRGLKSGMADALIAQSCIDHRVSLFTLDRDFRHYVRFGGLRIAS